MYKSHFPQLENLWEKFGWSEFTAQLSLSCGISAYSCLFQGSSYSLHALSVSEVVSSSVFLPFLSLALPGSYHTVVFSCFYLCERSVTPNQACSYKLHSCINFCTNISKCQKKAPYIHHLILNEIHPVFVNLGVDFSSQGWLDCCCDTFPKTGCSLLSPVHLLLQSLYYLQFSLPSLLSLNITEVLMLFLDQLGKSKNLLFDNGIFLKGQNPLSVNNNHQIFFSFKKLDLKGKQSSDKFTINMFLV